MNQLANVVSLQGESRTSVVKGRVISVSGQEAVIQVDGLRKEARVVFSCLVRPLPEDLVLCSADDSGDYYILGIIERPGSQDLTISVPANAALVAEQGSLSMVSGKDVTLATQDRLSCFSGRTVYKSREALVEVDELSARGENLQASFKNIVLMSRMISTMARHAIEKFVNYVRHSQEYDQVNAGQMKRKTDGLYSMDSQTTIMVSRKDTKIDGERIFMG